MNSQCSNMIKLLKSGHTFFKFSGVKTFLPDFEMKITECILLSGGWFFHNQSKFCEKKVLH